MDDLKSKNLITAVMTTYNLERFVRDSLRSVFSQTYEPLEIVISDDGSTDRTWEIIQQEITHYRAQGGGHTIIAMRNEHNLGVIKNFEKAIGMAHSEIVVECDGDDISRPNRVARIAEEFAKNPNLCCVMHNGVLIDAKEREVGNLLTWWSLWGSPLGAAEAYRFRKDITWPEITVDCYQDVVYTYRAIMSGDVVEINDDLIKYRVGFGISSSKTRAKWGQSFLYCLNGSRQSFVDLMSRRSALPPALYQKIETSLNDRSAEWRQKHTLFADGDFTRRWNAYKRQVKNLMAHGVWWRPGFQLDFITYSILLLPPGRLDFIFNATMRVVEVMRFATRRKRFNKQVRACLEKEK